MLLRMHFQENHATITYTGNSIQHSVEPKNTDRTHANCKYDLEKKKNKKNAEFRTKSALTGTEKLSSVVRN